MKHNSDNGWNTKSVSQDTFHPDRPESKFRRNAQDALVKIPKTGNCRLWLTWKLIRRQKLRTAAIFCGLMLSCCLLGAFGSFGYDFWVQVHEGGGEAPGYDQTQLILISLVTVLLSLVAACSGILLHNLYSLTFAGRWRSLTRLTALGAGPRDLLAVTLLENGILYCAAVSSGHILTALCVAKVGIQTRPPLWLTGFSGAEIPARLPGRLQAPGLAVPDCKASLLCPAEEKEPNLPPASGRTGLRVRSFRRLRRALPGAAPIGRGGRHGHSPASP